MHSKGFKKITAIFITVCMVISVLAIAGPPITVYADDPFPGGSGGSGGSGDALWEGSGTPGDPYQIRDDVDLVALCDPSNSGYWGYNFLQTDDITLPAAASGESNWTPIGDATTPFTGAYDGGGFTISNLTIDNNTLVYAGLFGYVDSSAYLRSIILEGVLISSGRQGAKAGGLVGYLKRGTVKFCNSTGQVTGGAEACAGGLVGFQENGTVQFCSSGGNVSVGDGAQAGGLIGGSSAGNIENSYSTANAAAGNSNFVYYPRVGGLVSFSGGTVINCYSAGEVTGGSGAYIGGLIGLISGVVTDSYYDSTVNPGMPYPQSGRSTDELKQQELFESWDFTLIWSINDSYPFLNWEDGLTESEAIAIAGSEVTWDSIKGLNTSPVNVTKDLTLPETGIFGTTIIWSSSEPSVVGDDGAVERPGAGQENEVVVLTASIEKNGNSQVKEFAMLVYAQVSWQGSGTLISPYEVASAAHLNDIRDKMSESGGNVYFKQTANIILPAVAFGESNWMPIGDGYINPFTKAYDGGGFTISNLTISDNTLLSVGLFGGVGSDGVLENIKLENVSVTSTPTQGSPSVGSLAGSNQGIVQYCGSDGSVAGGNAIVGGLVGLNAGTVSNSYSTGSAIGGNSAQVGGLVGFNQGNASTVSNSYSTGSATGGNGAQVGGLVGYNVGTVSNSYSTGSVTGGEMASVGGLVGYSSGAEKVTGSYYDSQTSGQSDTGKGMPKSTAEMKQPSTFAGWNSASVWYITAGNYPTLLWQGTLEPAEMVAEARDRLTWDIIKGENTLENHVTANLILPATSIYQTEISWYATPGGLINTATGEVTRPGAVHGDKTVILTATISRPEGASLTRTFELTVASFIDWEGDGTQESPYLVASAVQLSDIRNKMGENGGDVHFKQTADIILPAAASGESSWTPIGDSGNPFNGAYDGNGKIISNLTIRDDALEYVGLFGYVGSSGILENIGLKNVSIASSKQFAEVGGLAGHCDGIINSSYSMGDVTGGTEAQVGGLVGYLSEEVSDSYSIGGVAGGSGTGAGASVGGLVGYLGKDGTVMGTANVTGSYSVGRVSGGSHAFMGGLVGYGSSGQYSVTDSYYDSDISGQNDNDMGTPETTAQMKRQATFTGWNFGDRWLIEEGQSYPVFSWQVRFAGGDGSEDEPYKVETVLQLSKVRCYPSDPDIHFLQTRNITLLPAGGGASNWAPIVEDPRAAFNGTYDGGGHTISGLTINDATLDAAGLFGYIGRYGTVRNITLENVSISLEGDFTVYAGALAGYSEGIVRRSGSGGSIVCVVNDDGATVRIGGLIGENNGKIEDSYSTCDIDVISGNIIDISAGGLVGYNFGENPEGAVTNSYSTGRVSADTPAIADTRVRLGGLIGYQHGDVANTYSTGSVTGAESADIGGLIGFHDGGSVVGSYYLDTAAASSATGAALTATQMKQKASFEGWDFDTVWRISENRGYPVLQWQPLPPSGGRGSGTSVLTSNSAGNITVQPTLNRTSGIAGAAINNAALNAALEKAVASDGIKTVGIEIPKVAGASGYEATLPAGALTSSGANTQLKIKTDIADVTLPGNMIPSSGVAGASNVSFTVARADLSGLDEETRNKIGDRPVIQLTLSIDGRQTDWNNPDAPVTVSVPYTPTAAELADPESIVVWYIDGSGNAVSVPNGRYDPATGTVTFSTTHFSDYAVVYKQVSFGDVPAGAWYGKAVSFIAARDITTGTGGGNFSPGAKLTRGQFIVMLMKAYEIAPDAGGSQANSAGAVNFSDAGNTYYTGYLAAAKRLDISDGVGNNMFVPEKQITRQEMFALLFNDLKVIGRLPEAPRMPEGDSGKTLSDFSDADQVASWAEESMTLLVETGTVSGSGGKLSPAGTTTRAEMAQVLYNLLAK